MQPSKVLIITAHPSSKGFTHKIAAAFAEGAKEVGKEVEIIDLYKTNLKQDFMAYEEKSDMAKADPIRTAIQQKITDANELVFVHPLWWMGPPAIMKNFIDINISAKFAFYYKNGWPVGMLNGKKGHVFITCDGRRWLYLLLAIPFRTVWNTCILRLCGIKPASFMVVYEKYKKTEEYLNKFLAKVKERGKRY